jgi:hypothetical protein
MWLVVRVDLSAQDAYTLLYGVLTCVVVVGVQDTTDPAA